MPAEHRRGAVYMSKFMLAVSAGLFDAALNYLWDETIGELRKRIVAYDLNYFFDQAVTDPDKRRDLREPTDLAKITDDVHVTGIVLTKPTAPPRAASSSWSSGSSACPSSSSGSVRVPTTSPPSTPRRSWTRSSPDGSQPTSSGRPAGPRDRQGARFLVSSTDALRA